MSTTPDKSGDSELTQSESSTAVDVPAETQTGDRAASMEGRAWATRAPASAREVLIVGALAVLCLVFGVVSTIYLAYANPTAQIWVVGLYGASPLVFGFIALALALRSHYQRLAYLAAADGVLGDLSSFSHNHAAIAMRDPSFAKILAATAETARQARSGLLMSGDHDLAAALGANLERVNALTADAVRSLSPPSVGIYKGAGAGKSRGFGTI